MDPLTHTLVGVGLGQSGLKRRTRLATATLVIGSSLPDVDVISYWWGSDVALATRRGLTHGVPALLLWPLLLAGAMMLWDRWRPRDSGSTGDPPFRGRATLALAALAIWLHPALDTLNNYGMRWLMPFSNRWFYGDTLFIVEPLVIVCLAAGVLAGRRRERRGAPDWTRPARLALAASALFALAMGGLTLVGRSAVRAALLREGIVVERLMLSPVPLNPFRRFVVAEDATGYYVGDFSWPPSRLVWRPAGVNKKPQSPLAASAIRGPASRNFLSWARFPYFEEEHDAAEDRVLIGDIRYTLQRGGSFGRLVVTIDKAD